MNRIIFIDAHYPEWEAAKGKLFDRWSASQIVETVTKTGCRMFSFFAKDHWGNCYYPTKVGHRHRDVKGDFTGEIVNEARKQGLPIILYYSVLADDYAARTYPQWRTQNPNLRYPTAWGWGNVGLHQEYVDTMFLPQVKEICERYHPDGLFFDTMGDAEPCCCSECRERFKKIHGHPMNLKALAEDPRPWQIVRTRGIIDIYRHVTEMVRKISPDISLICGPYSENPDLLTEIASLFDMGIYESTVHYVNEYAGYLNTGLYARYYRTKPWSSTAVHYAFIGCWGELTSKPAKMFETEVLSSYSNGVGLIAADYLRPWGRLESETFRRIGMSFERIKALEPWIVGTKAVTHTAVLDSSGGGIASNPLTVGMGRILIDAHRQFDIVDETALDDLCEQPSRYKVIIVPSPGRLWKQERWQKLMDWVREGGHAVIEGSELLMGEASLLSEALGIKILSSSPYSAFYIKLDNQISIPDVPETPLLVHERPMRFSPVTAKSLCLLIDPIDEWDPARGISHRTSVLPPQQDTNGPAITIHTYGKGKAIFVAGSLSRGYWCHSHPWLRDVFLSVLNFLSPNPMQVDAPGWVETNLMSGDHMLVLHLVQFCLNHGSGFEKDYWHGQHYHIIEQTRPLFNMPFRLHTEKMPVSVKVVPENVTLEFDYTDGVVSSALPRLEVHAAVCLEF